jgi:hypothetical protein
MSRAWDEHEWRDVSPPGFMNVQELSPAERQAAEKAEEARAQQMARDYAESVKARREADAAVEASMDAVIAKGSEIKTPAQERAETLGWILQPDGSLVHKAEAERRAAQREQEEEGFATPEQRLAFLRENGLDNEYEEDEPEEDDGWSSVAFS